jgi:uncharacterized membrane protein YkvA (DUF1232 family)
MKEVITAKSENYYQFENLPKFPFNLFRFKEYDGAKLLSAILLLASFLFFISNFITLINKAFYTGFPITFWSCIQAIFAVIADTFTFVIILSPFVITYLLAWVIFDPRNVAMYALSITNILFGGASIVNPIDMIPDFIPVIGSIDDAFFGGGLIGLGVFIFTRALSKSKTEEAIVQLMNHHNEKDALQLLLADKGIKISKISSSN